MIWKRMVEIYGHKWSSQMGRAMDGEKLSDAATTWRFGLSGLTHDQVAFGFNELIASGREWPPSLLEFRKLCLLNILADVPTLDEVVSTLISLSTRQGSLARRYKHPLALAVSLACRRAGVDIYSIRHAKLADAKHMVKPSYEQCLKTGWNGWSDDDLKEPDDNPKALGFERVTDKTIGRQAFCNVRSVLGMRNAEFA
jgi:hypothetical protein